MKNVLYLLALVLLACSPTSKIEGPHLVNIDSSQLGTFADSYPQDGLLFAIDQHLAYFSKFDSAKPWVYGDRSFSTLELARSLRLFRELWLAHADEPELLTNRIWQEFDVYQLVWDGKPDILITGYHAPIYEGQLQANARFRFPLYAYPDDLFRLRPSRFSNRVLQAGSKLKRDQMMVRVDNASGEVLPYYSRKDIDGNGALAGRNLEIVYLEDYMSTFLFQVQGGGFVRLEDGSFLRLNYAGSNGRPYASIGRILVEQGKIPEDEISIPAILRYFDSHPEQIEPICFKNESYVFYEVRGAPVRELRLEDFPNGFFGFSVSSQRSIALDKRFFAGGALAFVSNRRPGRSLPFSAFAIDQDTGGAINGAHLDFFCGAGEAAETQAGSLNTPDGELFFLVAKPQE